MNDRVVVQCVVAISCSRDVMEVVTSMPRRRVNSMCRLCACHRLSRMSGVVEAPSHRLGKVPVIYELP